MTNTRAYDKSYAEEGWHSYSWLEDYLERLESKEAYREFQEFHYCEDPYYYTLVASLAA